MSADETVSCLTGSWTVNSISGQYDAFLEIYRNTQILRIDISGIEEFDLTFFQLIEAARICASQEGKRIELIAAANGEILENLQMGGFLSDPNARAFWMAEEVSC